jgi:hypothetical protein
VKFKRLGAFLASVVAGLTFVVGGPAVAAHAVDTDSCIPTVDYPQADGTVYASIYCPSGGIGNIDQNVYEDGNLVYQAPWHQCIGAGGSVVFTNCSETNRFGRRTSGHRWCQVTWFLLSGGTDEERNCIYPDGHTDYYSSGWY